MIHICGEPGFTSLTKEDMKNLSIGDRGFYSDESAYYYALEMTYNELNQAVEGLYHNLNTLQSRSGNQLPFSSINYGTCTLPEGRMVIKALLEGSINGVGKYHKTPIFPCGVFQCMDGVNRKEGDPNYDLFKLALKSTALRLYPNYCSCEWSIDESAFKQDRDSKQKIIDALTSEEKETLIRMVEENPGLKDFLMIDVVEE